MLFDHFIVIDWSARNAPSPAKPHKDAIWLAEGKADSNRTTTKYFRTRKSCYAYLLKRLHRLRQQELNVFVGFDLSFGYPQNFAKALGLKGKQKWKSTWQTVHLLIKDDDENRNNRFLVGGELNRRVKASLGPFWGVTNGQSGIFLGAKKDFSYPVTTPKGPLAEKRIVEKRYPGMQPAWKLAYTGSVGSQALMGIPYLYQLRFLEKGISDVSKVWPFETGFTDQPTQGESAKIVYAEIWPTLVERPGKDAIPDREQVRYYLKWLREKMATDQLGPYFATPTDLTKKELKACLKEEGWILGA